MLQFIEEWTRKAREILKCTVFFLHKWMWEYRIVILPDLLLLHLLFFRLITHMDVGV